VRYAIFSHIGERVKAHAASGRGCEHGAFGGAATDEGRWSYLVSWTRPTRADHGVSGALRVALVLSFSRCQIARTHGSQQNSGAAVTAHAAAALELSHCSFRLSTTRSVHRLLFHRPSVASLRSVENPRKWARKTPNSNRTPSTGSPPRPTVSTLFYFDSVTGLFLTMSDVQSEI
jgi:hypothetical protein